MDPHSFISSAPRLQLDPMRSEQPLRELRSDCTSCVLFTDWCFFLIFGENFDLFLYQNSAPFIFSFFSIPTIFISFKRTRRACENQATQQRSALRRDETSLVALIVIIDKGPEERGTPVFTRHIKAGDLFSRLGGVSHLLDVCVFPRLRADNIMPGSESGEGRGSGGLLWFG